MAIPRMRRTLVILLICFGAAFICAFVFIILFELSLPPSDAAYGKGLSIFLDPFVLFGSITYATVAALIAFPIALFCLRGRKLLSSSVFLTAVVLLEIALVTPFKGWRAFHYSFPALVGALLVCRYSKYKIFADSTREH